MLYVGKKREKWGEKHSHQPQSGKNGSEFWERSISPNFSEQTQRNEATSYIKMSHVQGNKILQ